MTRPGKGMLTLTLTSAVLVVGVIITIIVTIAAANKNRLLFFIVLLLEVEYLSCWSLLNNKSMKSLPHKHRTQCCERGTVIGETVNNILEDRNSIVAGYWAVDCDFSHNCKSRGRLFCVHDEGLISLMPLMQESDIVKTG